MGKAVVAKYNANELLIKRDIVSADIRRELMARANLFNLMLEDVAITHLSFSPEYARAVEAKQQKILPTLFQDQEIRFISAQTRFFLTYYRMQMKRLQKQWKEKVVGLETSNYR